MQAPFTANSEAACELESLLAGGSYVIEKQPNKQLPSILETGIWQ